MSHNQNIQHNINWFLRQTDETGCTILHYVASTDNVHFAEQLITTGCNVNATNRSGNTPLVFAVRNGQLNMMKKLLSFGAINIIREGEGDLLHTAAKYGWPDIVEFLIAAGANVNDMDKRNQTPLHVVTSDANNENATRDERRRIIQILIEAGADLTTEDFQQNTPLFNAFKLHSCREFDLMLNLKPGIVEQINFMYLREAIKNGRLDKLKHLIELGINVNMTSEEHGYNCLHVAVHDSNYEITDFLLKNNVNVNGKALDGLDPLCYALHFWPIFYPNCMYTPNSDQDTELKYKMILDKQINCLNLLLDNGYNVNNCTEDKTPLLVTLTKQFNMHSNVARILLKNGAKFDFNHPIVREVLDDPDRMKYAHLLLRQAALFVVRKNFDFQKLNVACQADYMRCQVELYQMKEKKIDGTTVSFFNVLDDRDIGPYTRNNLITEAFESTNFAALFPIYHDLLIERFSEESEYQELLKKATLKLSYLLNVDQNPSHLILNNILRYLDKKDISNLANV